jgi:hypothetical protein
MNQVESPFKFLDPYTVEDRDAFFGRDDEIDTLYDLVFDTNLILVYGPSGAGKTSLIQCGLANRFAETDWFDLHIRRRTDINESLHNEIRKNADTPIPDDAATVEALQSLYLDQFKPVFLIFDQFEELYILGTSDERAQFIDATAEILTVDFPVKILIVMREEYIAQLYDFEKEIPQLFDKRLRVEPMSAANVARVIRGSAGRFNIRLQDPEATISKIIDNISYGKSGIQLPYLQVYLDRLYREARRRNARG